MPLTLLTVGSISAYSAMKSNESLRKEEGRKKLKTYDFAYLVKKNNESLRKEEATKKKTENKKVQID